MNSLRRTTLANGSCRWIAPKASSTELSAVVRNGYAPSSASYAMKVTTTKAIKAKNPQPDVLMDGCVRANQPSTPRPPSPTTHVRGCRRSRWGSFSPSTKRTLSALFHSLPRRSSRLATRCARCTADAEPIEWEVLPSEAPRLAVSGLGCSVRGLGHRELAAVR
jgi:hypothetical protein